MEKFYCKRSNKFIPGQDSIRHIIGNERSNTFLLWGTIEVSESELKRLGVWAEHCNEDGSSLLDGSQTNNVEVDDFYEKPENFDDVVE